MPTLKINDNAGVAIEPQMDRSFSFRKYLSDLTQFTLPNLRFEDILNPALNKLPLDALDFRANFNRPVDIGNGGLSLTIDAGVSGGFSVATSKQESLDSGDRYGTTIDMAPGEAYVGFSVSGHAGAGTERKLGEVNFGFGVNGEFKLISYCKVSESDRFGDCLRAAIESFAVVADWDDLVSLPKNVVAVAEGIGSLRVSLAAQVAATPNPLFSVDLPAGEAKIQLTPGGTFGVATTFTVSGDYEVRIRSLGGSLVELGYYKGRGKSFEFTVEAVAGVSAGVGEFDLLSLVLGAISTNAKADRKALADGGLNEGQIDRIEDIIQEGIQRKVQVSLDATFGASEQAGVAFLFEIDTAQADAAAQDAIVRALHGDLTTLTGSTVRGVKLKSTVFHPLKERHHILRLNLLGIYNHISIGTMLVKSRLAVDANGDITILDQVTAERAGVSMTQFGADEEKLRKLLMESFLVSAAYHASEMALAVPGLRIEHVYFELHSNTSYPVMKDNLDVGGALDLLQPLEKRRLLGSPPKQFGRSTLFAAAGYDAALASKLFLDGSQARPAEQYEQAGLEALLRLFEPGDENDYIRLVAGNPGIWNEMKQHGFTQYARIYRDHGFALNEVQVQFLNSYAAAVIDWAKSMAAMSSELADWREWSEQNTARQRRNLFQERREKFIKRLKAVSQTTKAKWSEPWGLVAMYLALHAADRNTAGTQVRLNSRDLRWTAQRNPASLPDGKPLLEC